MQKAKEFNTELKAKSEAELHRMLAENREQLRDLRFKSSQNQLKEVRKIRNVKKAISRIQTALNAAKK